MNLALGDSMSDPNIFEPDDTEDSVERAKNALKAAIQYQQDWQESGSNRVFKYFEDVESDWMNEF